MSELSEIRDELRKHIAWANDSALEGVRTLIAAWEEMHREAVTPVSVPTTEKGKQNED